MRAHMAVHNTASALHSNVFYWYNKYFSIYLHYFLQCQCPNVPECTALPYKKNNQPNKTFQMMTNPNKPLYSFESKYLYSYYWVCADTSCPWYTIKALIITKTISPTDSKSQLDCLSLCISFQVLFSNDLGSSLAMNWQPFSANEQNNKGRVSINCNLLLVGHVMCTLSPPGGHCTLTRCLTYTKAQIIRKNGLYLHSGCFAFEEILCIRQKSIVSYACATKIWSITLKRKVSKYINILIYQHHSSKTRFWMFSLDTNCIAMFISV